MTPAASRLGWGLLWLALAAGGWWLFHNLEQVERERHRPMRGAALSDTYYGLKNISASLGVPLTVVPQLDPPPDTHITLVLDTPFWDLFPNKVQALKAWVERGGHLVVLHEGEGDKQYKDWLPHEKELEQPQDKASEDDDSEDAVAKEVEEVGAQTLRNRRDCQSAQESGPQAPWLGQAVGMTLCNAGDSHTLQSGSQRVLWQLEQGGVIVALRVQQGRGSITRVSSHAGPFYTPLLVQPEQVRALAGVLQWQRNSPIWLVSGEAPAENLAQWLWHRLSAGLIFLALALALWTWRRGVRFGPLMALPPAARRSMAEQIRGSAAFLLRHRSPALHGAALKALEAQVQTSLPTSRRLDSNARWALVAERAHVDAAALQRAVQWPPTASPSEQASALLLLESVRRRLQQRPTPSSTPSSDAS